MIIGLNSSRLLTLEGPFANLGKVCVRKQTSKLMQSSGWFSFEETVCDRHILTSVHPWDREPKFTRRPWPWAMICLTRINSTERSKLGNRAAMYFTLLSRGGREGESLKGLWKEGSRWWTCCSRWGRAWPRCGRQSNWWPGWRGRCSTLLLRLSRWGWRSTLRPSWWLALEVRQVSVLLSQSRCRVAPESS